MHTTIPSIDELRYPVGKFTAPVSASPLEVSEWIKVLEELPAKLRSEVKGLSDEQLDTPYREGGWTIRQVVHHLADSHMNSYMRMKLALTEDNPTIKPYFEERWAELPEAKTAPVEVSLPILESLHKRMVMMLRNVSPSDLERTFYHPETKKTNALRNIIALYAWHSRHHLAHITELKKRKGWS